jgi:hypothetical protein
MAFYISQPKVRQSGFEVPNKQDEERQASPSEYIIPRMDGGCPPAYYLFTDFYRLLCSPSRPAAVQRTTHPCTLPTTTLARPLMPSTESSTTAIRVSILPIHWPRWWVSYM